MVGQKSLNSPANNSSSASQGQRRMVTQGGPRPSSSKRSSGNGVNYPDINTNPNYVEGSPNKNRGERAALNSLDRSQQAQISQGIQIRDSYKEQ